MSGEQEEDLVSKACSYMYLLERQYPDDCSSMLSVQSEGRQERSLYEAEKSSTRRLGRTLYEAEKSSTRRLGRTLLAKKIFNNCTVASQNLWLHSL